MIHAHIAYGPDNKLAEAYNDIMLRYRLGQWVVFIDQDVFLCNPLWNNLCRQVVCNAMNWQYGVFSCLTNFSGVADQRIQAPAKHITDIDYHVNLSKKQWKEKRAIVQEAESDQLSGFFLMVSVSAWEAVGGFKDVGRGVLGVDWDFTKRVKAAGYKLGILQGLYVYHRGNMRKERW